MNSYLLVSNKEDGKVFEIKADGSVWYVRKGIFVEADTDKKLGKALGEALKVFVQMNKYEIDKQNKA